MRTVFKRIRANNKYALYPFFLAQLVFGLLVGAIVAVLFSPDASSDMTNGMTFSAGVSVVPFFLGLLMTVKHSVVSRSRDFHSLTSMGVSRSRILNSVRFEIFLGALFAGLAGGLLGRYVLSMMVSTLYGRLGGEMPTSLPSPAVTIPATFFVALVLGLLGSRRAVFRGLSNRKSVSRLDSRSPIKNLSLFVWVSVAVTIAICICIVALPSSFGLVSASIYILPFTLAASSPLILVLWVTLLTEVGKKLTGWSPWTISAREVRVSSGNLVFGVIILFICLPLSLFASNSASIDAARYSAANQVKDVNILTSSDGGILSPKIADQICDQLASDCRGVVSWSYAKKLSSKGESFSPSDVEGGTDYALTGTSAALDSVLSGEKSGTVQSAFSQEWMVPWGYVEAVGTGDRFADSRLGSVVVLKNPDSPGLSKENPSDVKSVSFKEFMHVIPERFFYGPGGTGTSEFIPLFASVILGGSILVFALLIGRQVLYIPTLRSLTYLGMGASRRKLVRVLANIHLASGALVASLGFYFIVYSTMLSSAGKFRLGFPHLPIGLVVYLIAIVLASTVLSSFFTTASDGDKG
ncbi:FtsX-like permease family protein [Corynebacterium macclintockiae]|uniref:FtsX-like permease family protein n=2 Tax=Corynebacterium macclintockiae TaxID=2913501 RepID=UPI003EBE98C1